MSYTTTESDDGTLYSSPPAPDTDGDGCRSSRWEVSAAMKKGPWSSDEDDILIDYVKKYGEGNWNAVQKHTGLFRCGKSCRLRWANHLRPNLKKGAFSQEEEQLIVELHAKMGNRWARMAAHLPGRTDNEIKNYWNTRIKRRQRAGLPLYPPQMCVEVNDWSQDYTKGSVLGGEDYLQLRSSWDSNVFFDGLSSVTNFVPGASPRYEDFMPPIVPSPKRLRETDSLYPWCSSIIKEELPSPEHLASSQTCSLSVPCDVNHLSYGNQHSTPVVIPNSHTLTDGIVPTSMSSVEALMLELPSFQYPEATFDQWKKSSPPPHSDLIGSYVQSPPPPMVGAESDSFSNCDTGLLDMLLLEAKIRNNTTKKSLYKRCTSATTSSDVAEVGVSHIKSEEFDDSFKTLVHSDISTPNPQRQREKVRKTVLDMTRPDVLLASSWLSHGLGLVKDTSSVSDAFAVLLGDDMRNDYMHVSTGASSSVGSCSWSNMPPVCQMTELP